MKTLKTKISTLLISLVTVVSFGQSNVWVKSENISQAIRTTEFVQFTNQTNVRISKPLSNSRNPELQKVYQIESDCDIVDLYIAMHKVSGLEGIVYGPTYETLEQPNDYTTTFSSNWALDLIGAQGAWDITTGESSVEIGISDQNFYSNHEELIGKINYYDTTNTSTKTHGTAVATIAAGNTNNGLGLSSIGYNSSLSLYRMNYNQVLQASYDGVRVINLSWASSCSFNQYAQAAINEVYNNGTFIVASAGNGSTCGGADNLVYPAAYENVFAVTSVGSQDNIEKTIGNPNTRHQTNSSVDICAPGFDVPLTAAPGWYLTSSGTSFAAPYVTGTIGLMVSINPNITNQEIDSILRVTATNIDLQNPNYVGKIGSGRLNSGMAVLLAQRLTIVVDVEDDGNNGHGNDEDGWDDSNPGQGNGNNGNGNNGNGNNGNGHGNVQDKPNQNNVTTTTIKMAYNNQLDVYDMNGKKINLNTVPSGMYLILNNGKITKIIK